MRTIILAAVVAGAAMTPVLGQTVLHAGLLYRSVRPMDFPFLDHPASPRPADGSFFQECALKIDGSVCVDLWRLKGRSPQRQGIMIRNNTDKNVRVRLKGCEVHNGPQTIAIDDVALFRNPLTGPFDDIVMPGDLFGLDFIHPAGGSAFPLDGMRPFEPGVTMTCRTATATPAPP